MVLLVSYRPLASPIDLTMRRRALGRLWLVSGCLLGHSLDPGRARRGRRPLVVNKPRLSGHLQAHDISRFANEGADLLGKGPDGGGTEESKKDLEEAEPNSPKP